MSFRCRFGRRITEGWLVYIAIRSVRRRSWLWLRLFRSSHFLHNLVCDLQGIEGLVERPTFSRILVCAADCRIRFLDIYWRTVSLVSCALAMRIDRTPNHALQRTAPRVTVAAISCPGASRPSVPLS